MTAIKNMIRLFVVSAGCLLMSSASARDWYVDDNAVFEGGGMALS